MIILSQLQLPTEAGTHQVTLDGQSADMLRALAGAWNQRVLLERVKTVTQEIDHPELRQYVERDVRCDLQETLANDRLTALWLSGPEWFKAPVPPEGRPSLEPENQAHVPPMPYFWVCRIRALVLPMATWDGASWLPDPQYRKPGETVTIYVAKSSLPWFEKHWGDGAQERADREAAQERQLAEFRRQREAR